MDEGDRRLRNATYGLFVELGRAPTSEETAPSVEADEGVVLAGWRRLHDQHALVLNHAGTELRIANPFSAVPTAFRVQAGGRWWYGNCAWDAFGICAALQVDGRIETSCPDCREQIGLDVRARRPSEQGMTIPVTTLSDLAHAWWGDRLAPDWRPHTRRAEAADPGRRGSDRTVLGASALADVPPLAEVPLERDHVGLPGRKAEVRLAPVQLAVRECEVEGALRLDRPPEEVLIRDVGRPRTPGDRSPSPAASSERTSRARRRSSR